MVNFAEYKILLKSMDVELNPPASPHAIRDAIKSGMPEFLSKLYSQFDGMAENYADPRNELQLGSIKICSTYRANLPRLTDIDHLFIVGHVLIYSSYIAVGSEKNDGVFYLDSVVGQAFGNFDDFMKSIYDGYSPIW